MKYRCLVVDHDDTVVNSTATIHYPCFVEFMKLRHPEVRMSLETYFVKNFSPGILELFRDIIGMSEEEIIEEEAFWKEYVKDHIPEVYPGMREILVRYKKEGGILAVASHSFADNIFRDYKANGLPEPDLAYGWELPKDKRKPDPFALREIMRITGLPASELLMLDDLKPGYEMARAAGVTFAAAGWANDISEIETFMRANCDVYFKTVAEFGTYLFG